MSTRSMRSSSKRAMAAREENGKEVRNKAPPSHLIDTPVKQMGSTQSQALQINQEEVPAQQLTMRDTCKLKIDVQLNVQIFRLRKIDNSTEELTVDLGITFMWNDPHLIHSTHGTQNFSTHPSISRFKPMASMTNPQMWPEHLQVGYGAFDPAWKIDNCSSMEIIKSICMVIDPKCGTVHNYIHLVATIHHGLDMRDFPFDKQHFIISIRSEHSDKVMQFIRFVDKREPKIFHVQTTEWIVQRPLELIFEDDNLAAASGARYVCAQFKFRVERKPEWYIYNVLLTSWLIVTASFSVFFIPEENISDRLGMIFTTWLLLISLKFVVADRLPKIAYLTIMDLYMIFSYVMMLALIGHTCVMGTLQNYFSEASCGEIDGLETSTKQFITVLMCKLLEYIGAVSDIYYMGAYLVVWTTFQFVIYSYYYI